VSIGSDWTPLKNRVDLFARFGKPQPAEEDVWQFESFRPIIRVNFSDIQ
jgi:homospermidine synthase